MVSYHRKPLKTHRVHGQKPLTIPPCWKIDLFSNQMGHHRGRWHVPGFHSSEGFQSFNLHPQLVGNINWCNVSLTSLPLIQYLSDSTKITKILRRQSCLSKAGVYSKFSVSGFSASGGGHLVHGRVRIWNEKRCKEEPHTTKVWTE